MSDRSVKALIISDNKPGHVNQARALVSIMGWDALEIVVEYPARFFKAAGYLLDAAKIYTSKSFKLKCSQTGNALNVCDIKHDFDVVIAVGSASYYPGKVIANSINAATVALMYPRGFRLDFDHIICPVYDNPPKKANITSMPVTLSSRDDNFYENAIADFASKTDCSGKTVSVIIGGDNKYGEIDPVSIKENLQRIFELTPGHKHWLTTSRRTSEEVEKIADSFPFDYKLIYSRDQYNPIPAFIALSDYIFLTSDSSSMVSECVSGGNAKLEILKNRSKSENKFDVFIDNLQRLGCLHVFDGEISNADKKLDVSDMVREELSDICRTELGA